jgi:hypothetical protein
VPGEDRQNRARQAASKKNACRLPDDEDLDPEVSCAELKADSELSHVRRDPRQHSVEANRNHAARIPAYWSKWSENPSG